MWGGVTSVHVPTYAWFLIPVACLPLLVLVRIMTATSTPPPEAERPIALDGAVQVLEGVRYMEYRIGVEIRATPAAIWALLSDAAAFPKWNSTVISITGNIATGERIELKAKVAPERTFGITVARKDDRCMVWQDGNRIFKGVRTFTVTPKGDVTEVTMAEVFTGAFLPQIAPKLPDFRDAFNTFAADLKRAAEA